MLRRRKNVRFAVAALAGVVSLAAISSLAARQIRWPAQIAADAAFAGPELDELVVTTADKLETPERGGTVVRAAAPVPGAPVPLAGLGG